MVGLIINEVQKIVKKKKFLILLIFLLIIAFVSCIGSYRLSQFNAPSKVLELNEMRINKYGLQMEDLDMDKERKSEIKKQIEQLESENKKLKVERNLKKVIGD